MTGSDAPASREAKLKRAAWLYSASIPGFVVVAASVVVARVVVAITILVGVVVVVVVVVVVDIVAVVVDGRRHSRVVEVAGATAAALAAGVGVVASLSWSSS